MTEGVTFHSMYTFLDHGTIIVQKEVTIESWDTSFDVYNKIQRLEIDLLKKELPIMLKGDYQTFTPQNEGNINRKADFDKLCEIDLQKNITWGEAIDRLRALSFNGYKNAYFIDEHGTKIFIDISLNIEKPI